MAAPDTQNPPVVNQEDTRCTYCSELANGLTEEDKPTCGDEVCGVITKPLPSIMLQEQ